MADKKSQAAAPAVSDARFQKVHNDPRFARLSSKKNKLQIDKRFAAVLHDDKFQSVQGKYDKYGRRNDKKINELKKFYRLDEDDEAAAAKSAGSDDDEEPADESSSAKKAVAKSKSKAKAKTKVDDDSDSESDSEEEEEEKEVAAEGDEKLSRLDYLNRMARGELESGTESSDESEDSDADAYMEESEEEEKEDIPMGDETKRFAVMNCDWTRIRAVDLFALFQSFAPATGAVQNVTIYPSDFGIERMKEEEQHGPQGLWADKAKKDKEAKDAAAAAPTTDGDQEMDGEGAEEDEEEGSDKEDAEEDAEEEEVDDGYDSDDPLGVKKSVSSAEADGFDVEKLRKYELQKLKYYYAVVTCDSVKTSAAIFENCDQLEYETSSNLLDLRYIPDEMAFTNPPKETCANVPETYKPAIFATMALQNTDVKLTWEEDDDQRVELLTRQGDWKNAHDDDFAAYLASENSSSEDEEEDEEEEDEKKKKASEETAAGKSRADRKKAAKLKKIKNRYRKMLLGSDAEDDSDDDSGNASGGADSSDDSEEEADSADDKPVGMDSDDDSDGETKTTKAKDVSGDMEMSFTPGASDILRAKRQKELEANETPFERYIREKKLEKNKKRHDKRSQQKEQVRETKDVLKKRGKAAPQELQALRAAIDGGGDGADSGSDDGDRNFDMKKIALKEKVNKLKGKRKTKELKKLQNKKTGLQEGFAFDAADPRFGALYQKGSQFQLDPTDPKFKKTDATQAIFQERRKRNTTQPKQQQSKQQQPRPQQQESGDAATKSRDLKAMVENLKRKGAPAVPASTNKKPVMKPFKRSKH